MKGNWPDIVIPLENFFFNFISMFYFQNYNPKIKKNCPMPPPPLLPTPTWDNTLAAEPSVVCSLMHVPVFVTTESPCSHRNAPRVFSKFGPLLWWSKACFLLFAIAPAATDINPSETINCPKNRLAVLIALIPSRSSTSQRSKLPQSPFHGGFPPPESTLSGHTHPSHDQTCLVPHSSVPQ